MTEVALVEGGGVGEWVPESTRLESCLVVTAPFPRFQRIPVGNQTASTSAWMRRVLQPDNRDLIHPLYLPNDTLLIPSEVGHS